jgi:cytochrome P450 family 4
MLCAVSSGNYTLPAGTNVILFIYALHHLEENFPNHDKFDPDRWANQESEDRNPFAYIPFSAGFRNCIGKVSKLK